MPDRRTSAGGPKPVTAVAIGLAAHPRRIGIVDAPLITYDLLKRLWSFQMGDPKLRGKTAIITGAAGGIGRATASLFAREGAALMLVDLNREHGERIVHEINASGGHAIFEQADVTRSADCKRTVAETIREFGGIDVLFNNAGIIRRASVVELNESDWDAVMTVNVKSIFLMSPDHGERSWRFYYQHRLGMGTGWRTARGRILRVERRGRSHDKSHGDRPWPAKYPDQLPLPG